MPVRRCVKDAGTFLQFLAKAFDANVVEKNQAHGEWGPRAVNMHLYVPEVDAVYERATKAGATSLSEPKNQFYGERNGGGDGRVGKPRVHRDPQAEPFERRSRAAGRSARNVNLVFSQFPFHQPKTSKRREEK
jgi:hypothetical protein